MADYEFRYAPLTGRLTGKQMIEQTEQAINALASQVDSAAGQVEIISTLANEANENAATALETAEKALATTGRTYITVSTQTDANNYYDSQLIYIADSTSTNIPVADTGMLEVKTNDNKTACEQVFISDSSGDAYYRNGAITAETVGDVTTYSVTWSGWSSQPASQAYVQGELTNYLPLSGGTLTGVVNGVTPTAGDNSTKIATTEFVNAKAGNYLPLSGGTLKGDVLGVTPPNGDNSKKLANTEFIQALASILVPTGCVQAFAGSTTPQGWLLCDGSAVSRTTYAALFAVIGTTYGAGNGSTTFNLPNLVDKFVQGSATAGTVKSAGLPNITGRVFSFLAGGANENQGALYQTTQPTVTTTGNSSGSAYNWRRINLDASRSNSIYGNSTTVQPPALTMRYIIKY